MEDRLNPLPPEGADENTIGGYQAIHGRSPGFEGADGFPYTLAIETEAPQEDGDGWAAYIVFLRWAADSTAIMGHVETGDMAKGQSEAEARAEVGQIKLADAKNLLDRLIEEKRDW